ncbi:MAG: methionyl-tRNA formyltransferase [Anaerolineales bacterium]|jgi:methionyl-tRNA formyltransferase|nr:methionyl-tRNA formyltransferase [Anaerolineales bacterium]
MKVEADSTIVFMGSPEFAAPVLRALNDRYRLAGVVTQPDRPSGRGRTLKPPPVKELALELRLPFIQPRRLREPEAMDQLRCWAPDLIVVAAFGQILRQEVLDLPPLGCVNVHASLLPRWRGAAPIQAAILHGDAQTGVTIMCLDAGIDTGAMLTQRATPIGRDETAGELSQRLAVLGAELLIETLPDYLSGRVVPQPQDDSFATYASTLNKEDGKLDFHRPAAELERQVRAFQPWPGAFFDWHGTLVKVRRAAVTGDQTGPIQPPGGRVVYQEKPAICTGEGLLVLEEIQPAGKRSMSGSEFLQGARGWA